MSTTGRTRRPRAGRSRRTCGRTMWCCSRPRARSRWRRCSTNWRSAMVRALVVGSAAMVVATLAGGPLIEWLIKRGFIKGVSQEGPESHLSKAGTPTMGGLLVLGTFFLFTLTTFLVGHPFLLLPLGAMAVAAVVGFADDLLTIQGRERLGGHERGGLIAKALLGGLLGLVAGLVVYYSLDQETV